MNETPGIRGGPRRGLGRGGLVLFVGLLILQLVPLWSVATVPTQDGPVHLEISAQIRRLAGGGDGLTERYLRLKLRPEPNWLVYLPLAAALEAVPPRTAEKLLLSLYALALPLSALYAARAVAPAGAAAAFLAFPLVFNYPAHMGFYDFSFTLPLFYLTLGWWWPRRAAGGAGRLAGLAAWLLLCALAHPVGWVLTVALLGVIGAWDGALAAVQAPAGRRWRAGWRRTAPQAGRVTLASLPGLALLLSFLSEEGAGEVVRLPLRALVKHLLLVYSLVSYRRLEIVASVATGVVLLSLAALALRRRRRPLPHDALLLASGLFLAIYFVAPLGLSGGGYLNQRVQLFVFLALVPWLAGEPLAASRPRLVAGAGAVLALAFLLLHGGSYRRLAPELARYRTAAAAVPAGSTVLPLSFAHHGERRGRPLSLKVEPFQNAFGYAAAERALVDLADYQEDRGYFPVVYRPACDPERRLGDTDALTGESPRPRLDGYRGRAGCAIDYVLLWDPEAPGHEEHAAWLHGALRRHGFRPVALPAEVEGRAELWRGPEAGG